MAQKVMNKITQVPRCKTPTFPGVYLCQHGIGIFPRPEVAYVRMEDSGFSVSCGVSVFSLKRMESNAIWWGPIAVEK